jgi:hypothetical protein
MTVVHRRRPEARRSALVVSAIVASCLTAIAQSQPQRTAEEYAKSLEGAERVARMQVPFVIPLIVDRSDSPTSAQPLGVGKG